MNKEIANYDTYAAMSKGSNPQPFLIILGKDLDHNIPDNLHAFKASIEKSKILNWENYSIEDHKGGDTYELKNISNGQIEEFDLIPISEVFSNASYAELYKSLRKLSPPINEIDDAIYAVYNKINSVYTRYYPEASLQVNYQTIGVVSPTELPVNDISNSEVKTKGTTKRRSPKGSRRSFKVWI